MGCGIGTANTGQNGIDAGWLSRFPYPHQQLAFEELKRAIDQIETRVATLDGAIEDRVPGWHFSPVDDALRALRGVNTTIAATVVAEIGDITRLGNPRQLMARLDLVPSEHSSGSTKRRGRLTKTGNALARTMLVEADVLHGSVNQKSSHSTS